MGKPYHLGFHSLSSRQFCSKFAYETYLNALDVEIGTLESFKTLLTSQPETPLWFWRLWFMGRIPWSRITVTPASQLRSERLEAVWESNLSPLKTKQHKLTVQFTKLNQPSLHPLSESLSVNLSLGSPDCRNNGQYRLL